MTSNIKAELIADWAELHNKILESKSALETKLSVIRTAIENEEYVIHPQRIVQAMLLTEEEFSPESLPY
jgi:anti-sigma28 factor (negative regulator of flagellin synthesis)